VNCFVALCIRENLFVFFAKADWTSKMPKLWTGLTKHDRKQSSNISDWADILYQVFQYRACRLFLSGKPAIAKMLTALKNSTSIPNPSIMLKEPESEWCENHSIECRCTKSGLIPHSRYAIAL
jgi:hypothetical protein